jgi:hypothetical protein
MGTSCLMIEKAPIVRQVGRITKRPPDAESEGFAVEWPTHEDFGAPVPRLH